MVMVDINKLRARTIILRATTHKIIWRHKSEKPVEEMESKQRVKQQQVYTQLMLTAFMNWWIHVE